MVRVVALAALALACSSAAPELAPVEASPAPLAPAAAQDASPAPAAPRLRFAATAEVAEDALAAVDLWRAASAGAFDPEFVVSDECSAEMALCFGVVPVIADCDGPAPEGQIIYGCTQQGAGTTRISVANKAQQNGIRISVLAHELGHSLGLEHSASPSDDLMNPGRSLPIRRRPCVTAENVELAGFEGPGACLGE